LRNIFLHSKALGVDLRICALYDHSSSANHGELRISRRFADHEGKVNCLLVKCHSINPDMRTGYIEPEITGGVAAII